MEITSRITNISYYKKETGYAILVTALNHADYLLLHEKYNLVGSKIVCVGVIERQPYIDEEYTFTGDIVNDSTYGLQFKFTSFKRSTINSKEAIIDYLSSDLFPGIGIVKASQIVDVLGKDAINSIIKDKNCLKAVPKLTKKQTDTIYETIKLNIKNQEAFMFFIQNGLSLDLSKKIVDEFGSDCLKSIKENPYQLIERIDYMGFNKCDRFALRIGIKPNSYNRLSHLLIFMLQDIIYKKGNSYVDKTELLSSINKYLVNNNITRDNFNDLLNQMIKESLIIEKNGVIFDYNLFQKELHLAKTIVEKLNMTPIYKKETIDDCYEMSCKDVNITLNIEQEKAVKEAFLNPLSIITGGPGTGKSTIVKFILDMYVKLHKNDENSLQAVKLIAPTGKASKRLNEITHFEAMTIHRYLGFNGYRFEYGPNNKTDDLFIIIDEASMMDLPLAYQLFSSLNNNCQIVIVGDVDQLPSVGPGQILKDLIDTKEITTTRLKKIHRQGANSKIIELAHSINEGILPSDLLEEYDDRCFIKCDSLDITDKIHDIIKKMIDDNIDIINDTQILAPMYRTVGGINELNKTIQSLYNKEENKITINFQNYKVGDKVIQLVNRANDGIMNGDIGVINRIVFENEKAKGLIINFDIGKKGYNLEQLEEISLAYAISVHKSQGSEFPIVILPISQYYSFMLKRKLVYTAITRAKQKLILVGDPEILRRGIVYIENPRLTMLRDLVVNLINNQKDELTIEEINSDEFIEKPKEDNISPYDFESIIGEEEYDI